jgi:UDP:flavonoid glycosyltransferase YjiC (YdhE family)
LSIPANIRAAGFLPHEVVLPTADLLITHAGHGTVMAGVGHGVPMLCVPMGRDQPAVAARVEELGLGVAMPADARTDELAAAISRSLEDSEMSKRAQRFANALTHHAGLSRAVEIVEALLEEGKGATL